MGGSRILSMIEDGEPRRASPRRRVMMVARLSTSTKSYEVRIRDVSATGARIEAAELPPQDTSVLLTRGVFSAYGRLVWANGECGGILFDDPLEADTLMETLRGMPAVAPAPAPFRRAGLNRSEHPRFSDGSGWIDVPRRH